MQLDIFGNELKKESHQEPKLSKKERLKEAKNKSITFDFGLEVKVKTVTGQIVTQQALF